MGYWNKRRKTGMKLQGKVAVITGGSSGIGLETAKTFVREGAYAFVTGRRQTELEKVETLLKHNVTAVQSDVSKLGDLDRLFKKVADEKGAELNIRSSADTSARSN
jgi:NAD(P)-dependent dehydrogenase (short-subunit alcohol dehydrogenase family)